MAITPIEDYIEILTDEGTLTVQPLAWVEDISEQVNFNSIATGTGSPESVLSADPLKLYMDDAGTAGSILYIKKSGEGNTGWILSGSGGGGGISIEPEVLTVSPNTDAAFTGIAAGTIRITMILNKVITSAASYLEIQIGDSGGYETTGYESECTKGTSSTPSLIAFQITRDGSTLYTVSGHITFTRINASHDWVSSGVVTVNETSQPAMHISGGFKTLSAELDRIRLQIGQTGTFNGGSVTCIIE